MRNQKGATLIELLIALAMIFIFIVITIAALSAAIQVDDRTNIFGHPYSNLPRKLTPEHIKLLRPVVEERLAQACDTTATLQPTEIPRSPSTTDPVAIQAELDRLANLPSDPDRAEICRSIRAGARREGFLSAETP